MATLRSWIDNFTKETGEVPTHIAIGSNSWGRPWTNLSGTWPLDNPCIDREFDTGYGGEEGPDVTAWSPNWVIVKATYDGAEWLSWVPRNPVDKPHGSIGGG